MSESWDLDELAKFAKSNPTYGAAVKRYLATTGLYESVPVGGNKNVHQWRTAPGLPPKKHSNFKKLFAAIRPHNFSVLKGMPMVRTCMHACMLACSPVCLTMYLSRSPMPRRPPPGSRILTTR